MKLHLNQPAAQNLFTAYGEDFVQINATRHESSVIVTGADVEAWDAKNIQSLEAGSFARLLEIRPEIIIIGTGQSFKFPAPASLRPLVEARIGHEVMDTGAACRTFNILIGEGRNVLAALIVGEGL
jgi:uncharacterized protein